MRSLRTWSLVITLAACGCSGAPLMPAPPPAPSRATIAVGRAFVQRACAGCHAVGRTGDSPNSHAPAFRGLAARRSDAELAHTLRAISREGHLEMPPIYMTPIEQAAVVAYLRSLTARST